MKIMKKAILFIHGFAGNNYDYCNLPQDLKKNIFFDIYTFTLPGHDKNIINKVTKEDWINESENQINLIIKKGYKRIYVIGHSMGGVIACHLAQKYPEVKKLILAAPAFKYFTFKDDKLDALASLKQTKYLFKNYDKHEILSRILKIPIPTIKEFMNLVKEHNKDIINITCPTLIIWGTNDIIVPVDSVNYIYNNINSNRVILYQINNVTHDIFKSNRYKEVLKIIKKFLKENKKNKKEINKI